MQVSQKNKFFIIYFQKGCLELIQSNDHQLRFNLHFEIAKSEMQNDLVVKAEQQLRKALELDYSIPLKKLNVKIDEGER